MRAGGCIWDPWHNRGCRTMRRAHFAMAATTTIHCTIHNVKGLQHNWHNMLLYKAGQCEIFYAYQVWTVVVGVRQWCTVWCTSCCIVCCASSSSVTWGVTSTGGGRPLTNIVLAKIITAVSCHISNNKSFSHDDQFTETHVLDFFFRFFMQRLNILRHWAKYI